MRLCVIPARAGSRRIPGKNIKLFDGKPIISHVIQKCLDADIFDQVVVSTDSEEIACVAIAAGAAVPSLRSKSLSGDTAPTKPVIRDAISNFASTAGAPSSVCCVYPTSVFVTAEDLRSASTLLEHLGVEFIISVQKYPHPIERALVMNETDSLISPKNPESVLYRTQDCEQCYFDAAQFYWGTTKGWMSNDSAFTAKSAGWVVKQHIIDIDTPDDFCEAEKIYKAAKEL